MVATNEMLPAAICQSSVVNLGATSTAVVAMATSIASMCFPRVALGSLAEPHVHLGWLLPPRSDSGDVNAMPTGEALLPSRG